MTNEEIERKVGAAIIKATGLNYSDFNDEKINAIVNHVSHKSTLSGTFLKK